MGLAISILFGILGMMPDVWFVLAGTMICWFDLRYFCPDKAGLVGDATGVFAFATFFPKFASTHLMYPDSHPFCLGMKIMWMCS